MSEDTQTKQQAELEFWFDFGSNYSYLSVMRIRALARRFDVSIQWRPFLLGPIFKSFGWDSSPFVLQKEKGNYMWQDMVRQCDKYGIAWQRPSVFPRHSLLPVRVALYGAEEPWIGEFCERVMLRNFTTDQDINAEDSVADILERLELNATSIIQSAQGEANKCRLKERTEQAKALGIFGAPTFFVHGEMFWGNDRLDDAIEYACRLAYR